MSIKKHLQILKLLLKLVWSVLENLQHYHD